MPLVKLSLVGRKFANQEVFSDEVNFLLVDESVIRDFHFRHGSVVPQFISQGTANSVFFFVPVGFINEQVPAEGQSFARSHDGTSKLLRTLSDFLGKSSR